MGLGLLPHHLGIHMSNGVMQQRHTMPCVLVTLLFRVFGVTCGYIYQNIDCVVLQVHRLFQLPLKGTL